MFCYFWLFFIAQGTQRWKFSFWLSVESVMTFMCINSQKLFAHVVSDFGSASIVGIYLTSHLTLLQWKFASGKCMFQSFHFLVDN